MPTTAQEVYKEAVRELPPTERLRLAALILDDLAQANVVAVEGGDDWTEEDQRDATAFSLRHAAALYTEDEELV